MILLSLDYIVSVWNKSDDKDKGTNIRPWKKI